MKKIKILGIETSCDDTALALVEASGDINSPKFALLKNIISSQLKIHKEFGGIVPGLAKREHEHNLVKVFYKALSLNYVGFKLQKKDNKPASSPNKNPTKKTNAKIETIENILERYPDLLQEFKEKIIPLKKPALDLIAVTHGPGLEPALWVGVNFARALSTLWDIELLGIDHMEGHIAVNLLSEIDEITKNKSQISKNPKKKQKNNTEKIEFPAVALAVSGGHTQLILVKNWLDYDLLGETLDDAAGEAFDKIGRLLGLPFPGGPHIEKLAQSGKADAFNFPRPMLNRKNYDFSFSGLKTAVLYTLQKMSKKEIEKQKSNIAASFQEAVVDTLVTKTIRATKDYNAKTVLLAGGVAANKHLKHKMGTLLKKECPDTKLIVPSIKLATDNGAMIAVAGYLRYLHGDRSNPKTLEANSTKLITEN